MIENHDIEIWLQAIATCIESNQEPTIQLYRGFVEHPMSAFAVIDKIAMLDERGVETKHAEYSACIFALDVCVAQFQSALENGNKQASRELHQLMDTLAEKINQKTQTLLFWLPILNAFYDVHVELNPALKAAYLNLVENDEEVEDDISYIHSIRELIRELSDLTVFDIAEHFFAQSYAMPPEFFSDLLLDLFEIEEGLPIGLLALLHPEFSVREVVTSTLDVLLPKVTLDPSSLTRLKAIAHWYPSNEQSRFSHWIKEQRLKEVTFQEPDPARLMKIIASEIDGGGAQGLFIKVRRGRKYRMCGLLVKYAHGVKDVWLTPYLSSHEMKQYEKDVFNDDVVTREVDMEYAQTIIQHFLDETLKNGQMPDLHLLELQEELGLMWVPESIDVQSMIAQLSVQIEPFTPEVLQNALKRSKHWFRQKPYARAWFVENPEVDKWVNRYSAYENGVKTCRYEEAMRAVFEQEFELRRERWIFHFLWVSLWLKGRNHPRETLWKEIFLIAYAIETGIPMAQIPVMQVICHHTVLNSVETMQSRKTHLS